MFSNMFVSYYVRMQCTLGIYESESFSSYNPGMGLKFSFIDKTGLSFDEMYRAEIVNTVLNIIILVL